MPAPLNLTGQRFGELIALRVAEKVNLLTPKNAFGFVDVIAVKKQ